MEKVNLILVAIIVMSVSVFSQTKDTLFILVTKDTVRVYDNFNFHKLKSKTDKNFFEKLNLLEAERYFNSIFQKLNVNIGIVSGGGYGDFRVSDNIGIRVKYGSLKLDDSFRGVRGHNNRRIQGKVFGVNLGIQLKEKNNFKLFLSIGNDWIKIGDSKTTSNFNYNIGIKIKN